MEIKKVSIIGLGALGILFGNLLSKHMNPEDLRIIADRERIERYKRDGIFCNGEKCDFCYLLPEEPCEPADLLLFAVKFNALDDAVKAVRNQVGPDTIILSLLNGISSESIIGDAYGMPIYRRLRLPKDNSVINAVFTSQYVRKTVEKDDVIITNGFCAPFLRADCQFAHGSMYGYGKGIGRSGCDFRRVTELLEAIAGHKAKCVIAVAEHAFINRPYQKTFEAFNYIIDATPSFDAKNGK